MSPGQQADDLVGGDAAVGAADPEIGGRLLARELGEEFRILAEDSLGPFPVVLEQLVEVAHVGATLNVRACFGKKMGTFLIC